MSEMPETIYAYHQTCGTGTWIDFNDGQPGDEPTKYVRSDSAPWMPIESAPMNGRWILVWWPKASKIPFTAYYDYQNKQWRAAPSGGALDKHAHRTSRKVAGGPAAWQPIPDAPNGGKNESND